MMRTVRSSATVTTSPAFTGRLAARDALAVEPDIARVAAPRPPCACAPRARATAICRCAGGHRARMRDGHRANAAPCWPRAVPSARRAWRTASSDRPGRRAARSDRTTRAPRRGRVPVLEVRPSRRADDPRARDPAARRRGVRAAADAPCSARPLASVRSRAVTRARDPAVLPGFRRPAAAADVSGRRGRLWRRLAARGLQRADGASARSRRSPCGRGGRARRSSGGRPGRHTSIISGSAGFASASSACLGRGFGRRRLGSAIDFGRDRRDRLRNRRFGAASIAALRLGRRGGWLRRRLGDRRSGLLRPAHRASCFCLRRRSQAAGFDGLAPDVGRATRRVSPASPSIAERTQHRGEILARRAGERGHVHRHGEAAALDRARRPWSGDPGRHASAGRIRSASRSRISTRTARSPHTR